MSKNTSPVLTLITLQDLGLEPVKVSPRVDPDDATALRVSLTLERTVKRQGDDADSLPLDDLAAVLPGVADAIAEAEADDSEESVDYRRRPKKAFVLDVAVDEGEKAGTYNARVDYVRVTGSAKRSKITVRLVFAAVDPADCLVFLQMLVEGRSHVAPAQGELFSAA